MKRLSNAYALIFVIGAAAVFASSAAFAEDYNYTTYPQVQIADSQEVDTCNAVPGETLSNHFRIDPRGIIKDLDLRLRIDHPYIGDLEVTLTSPQGTTVTVVETPGHSEVLGVEGPCGCTSANINTRLDDDSAGGPINDACPATGPDYNAENLLSVFKGEDMSGAWFLEVRDWNQQDSGELVSWGLDIEYVTLEEVPADQPLALWMLVMFTGILGAVALRRKTTA